MQTPCKMFARLSKIPRGAPPTANIFVRHHPKPDLTPLKHIKDEILITDQCANRLRNFASENAFLRITVEGGGCSGFQYKFDLDSKMCDDDRVFEKNGAKVVIDDVSLSLVKGSTIDYQEELIRSSFKIVNNPLAEKGCSCGASFAVRLD